MLHLWFITGFLLALFATIIQLIALYALYKEHTASHWLTKLYIILDSALIVVGIGWLGFGAYWRFSDQGKLCASNYIPNQANVVFLFYSFGAALLMMCALFFCCGLCAGYWSYYYTLPIRSYNSSSFFCCLCDN